MSYSTRDTGLPPGRFGWNWSTTSVTSIRSPTPSEVLCTVDPNSRRSDLFSPDDGSTNYSRPDCEVLPGFGRLKGGEKESSKVII